MPQYKPLTFFDTLRCCRCREYKSFDQFDKRPGTKLGITTLCQECRRAYINQRTQNEPEHVKQHRRFSAKARRYGMSPEDHARMEQEQGGRCLICATIPTNKHGLVVDHDHATGAIRGLLCSDCNRGLGGFKDNEVVLQRAINYINEARHRHK